MFNRLSSKLAASGQANTAFALSVAALSIQTDVRVTAAAATEGVALLANGTHAITIGPARSSSSTYATGVLLLGIQVVDSSDVDSTLFSGLVAFRDTEQVIVTLREGQGSDTIGEGHVNAGIFGAPDSLWTGTGGSATLTRLTTGADCANVPAGAAVRCRLATFTTALRISSSVPTLSDTDNAATGNRTFELGTSTVSGVLVIIPPELRHAMSRGPRATAHR